jgi:hypothetical protein
MIHVAILHAQYVRAILDGCKTIEIRLTMTNRVPFEAVEIGERLYFKHSGGPILGTGLVDHVLFNRDLTPRDIEGLRRDYNKWIGGGMDFWRSRKRARFATLIWLRDVEPVRFGPRMRPHHGVAWQCLPEREDVYPACRQCAHVEQPVRRKGAAATNGAATITLTEANIRHGHIYLTGLTHRFPPDCFGGSTRADAGHPLRLQFEEGELVETDIVRERNIFRSRAWRSWFAEQRARAGDQVRLAPLGPREFRVSLIRRSDVR